MFRRKPLLSSDQHCPLTFYFGTLMIIESGETPPVQSFAPVTGDRNELVADEEQLYWRSSLSSSAIVCSQLVDAERAAVMYLIDLTVY